MGGKAAKRRWLWKLQVSNRSGAEDAEIAVERCGLSSDLRPSVMVEIRVEHNAISSITRLESERFTEVFNC